MTGFSMSGPDLAKRLHAQANKVRDARGKALYGAGRHILNVSNRTVPHEEGDLERDGAVTGPDSDGTVAITYGRSADVRDYAVPQHERFDYTHDAGRGPKFLENAMNSEAGVAGQMVATELGREWQSE